MTEKAGARGGGPARAPRARRRLTGVRCAGAAERGALTCALGLDLAEYLPLFRSHKVASLDTFLCLAEADLEDRKDLVRGELANRGWQEHPQTPIVLLSD